MGNVIVEYPSIQQAAGAVVALIGRRFNKHIIRAAFMSETAYANKQYNVYTDLLPNMMATQALYLVVHECENESPIDYEKPDTSVFEL